LEIADKVGIKVINFDEVLSTGEKALWEGFNDFADPEPEDILMFSYTSGTTGDPKGVKLSQKMIVMMCSSINYRNSINGGTGLNESDTYISYLPASHSYEQGAFGLCIIFGMKCGFYGGNPLKMVSDDFPVLKPTFFPSVPRLYNRIYGLIKDKINGLTGCQRWLADKAIATKLANL